jgi:Mrp family chromosome partitioning ATPase
MEAFVGAAKAAVEVVVVDTAPVIVTADALGLAPLVRGVLFVLRSGVVSSREATRALEPFRDREVLLAAVVNGIRRSPADDNFYHKYGYYYVVPPAAGGNPSGAGSGERGPDPAPKPDPREVPINS